MEHKPHLIFLLALTCVCGALAQDEEPQNGPKVPLAAEAESAPEPPQIGTDVAPSVPEIEEVPEDTVLPTKPIDPDKIRRAQPVDEAEDEDGEKPRHAKAVDEEDSGSGEKIPKGKAIPESESASKAKVPPPPKQELSTSTQNDPNARTLFLNIPAPRGQITDQYGEPLAQNKIAYFLGLQFDLKANLNDSQALDFARDRMAFIRKHSTDSWEVRDEKILEHYKNRRWLPLLNNKPVMGSDVEALVKALPSGVVAVPSYMRFYPEHKTLGHVIGHIGRTGGLPTGPINNGDSIWPESEGKIGLEKKFQQELAGTPGKLNVIFDARGEMLSKQIVEKPKPGATVVTSIDLGFQRIVERIMKDRCRRGAFVIMDVQTGDIVSMVSNPSFDPNSFAMGMSAEEYNELSSDPRNPQWARATQGSYPPASTFKVVTCLAALESGKVTADTYFNCPAKIDVGSRLLRNHNHREAGSLNVIDALKLSNNPWMVQAAWAAGATRISSTATMLGLGQRSGYLLTEQEVVGNVPNQDYWRKKYGAAMVKADVANMCIGQGEVETSPLQVCAMMAAIGRGDALPKARLVRQVQDIDGTITKAFPITTTPLQLDGESLRLVRAGMRAVVEESGGTGRAAGNSYVEVAGKTGTAQWKKLKGEWVYLAWFAGFIPAKNPQYAFAAVYEGDPGEDRLSGGKKVAPIVGSVFEDIYEFKKKRGDSRKALAANSGGNDENGEESEEPAEKRTVKKAKPAEAPSAVAAQPDPAAQAAPRKTGLRWLVQKLRGK